MILALAIDWMEGITPESVPGGTIELESTMDPKE
jgi:hypothetical protein